MSAPTPGPWFYEQAHQADGFGIKHTGFRILEEDRRVIAEIFTRPYPVFVSEANASLIAHAPDMHAFIAQLARMTPDGEDGFVMDKDDAVSCMSGLIEQARGLLAGLTETLPC